MNFKSKETEMLFHDRRVSRFKAIERPARRQLLYLHRARTLRDLSVPPGNRLEALKKDRAGQHGIRINDQWRICFRWKEAVVPKKLLEPIYPGEILLEEFMKPLGVSINKLGRDIDVPPGRVSEIVNGKRAITADTALRLGRYFGVSPELWINLQADYELRVAMRDTGKEIENRVRPFKAAS